MLEFNGKKINVPRVCGNLLPLFRLRIESWQDYLRDLSTHS
jgi:hypothetical protein